MDVDKAINRLKAEADKNRAAKDVFKMWQNRDRTRNQVTVRALALRMKEEGYNHSPEDYAKVLKAMADAGLGQLKFDRRANVVALVDVQTTLQSVGAAVTGKGKGFKEFKRRAKFSDLGDEPPQAAPSPVASTGSSVSITVSVNGKPITVTIPSDLPANEIAALVKNLTGSR